MHNVTLGGMALDKPPAKESESGESAGDASAEPTKDEESTTGAESTTDAEPAKDSEPEKPDDGSADAKPELVGSSAEPKKESESEA